MPETLFEIPGLEGLGRACRRFNVQFTAFGGVIRRYAAWLEDDDAEEIDLFHLTPFLSDVDLVHTGGPELTPQIYRFLQTDIPFAECFRWELKSVEENALYFLAMQANGIIPVNLMSLSTNAATGILDPWNGFGDIQNRQFRFLRNGFYPQSPLAREGRDLEFFGVVLYFRILFEMGITAEGFPSQPGWSGALEVIEDARQSATITALQESAYLRSRLRYLLKSLTVASPARSDTETVYSESGLGGLLDECDDFTATRHGERTGPVRGFRYETGVEQDSVLTSSARIGGDLYRIPHQMDLWQSGPAAISAMEGMLAKPPVEPAPYEAPQGYGENRTLGEGQEVLLASPSFRVRPGVSESSWLNQSTADEFLHFAVPTLGGAAAALRKMGEKNLAVVLALVASDYEGQNERVIFFPFTSACALKPWGETPWGDGLLLTIRMNAGALPEIADGLFLRWRGSGQVNARIFVVGWPDASSGEAG